MNFKLRDICIRKEIVTLVCIVVFFMSIGKAQEGSNKKELRLVYPSDSVVYYDETPEFVAANVYEIIFLFNNPIAKVDINKAMQYSENNGLPASGVIFYCVKAPLKDSLEEYIPNTKLDTVIRLHYWDSTHYIEDPHNPGSIIYAPIYGSVSLFGDVNNCDLRIPAETFTDIYGNKNKAIHIMYKRKRK